MKEPQLIYTSRRGALLVSNGEYAGWFQRRQRRADGSFTEGVAKKLNAYGQMSHQAALAIKAKCEKAATKAAAEHARDDSEFFGVELCSDAKASNSRFGITTADGEPVWYGRFFDDDRDFNGEQSSGEMAAAKKAVWLASKFAEKIGRSVKLNLKVDAEWLVWANAVRAGGKSGGKARELGEAAERLGVRLRVEHIPGVENPADEYTICSGFLRWQDGIEKIAAPE